MSKDLTDEATRELFADMAGAQIDSVEPLIFDNSGVFRVDLILKDKRRIRFEAIAMHGMEARIAVQVQ